MYVNIWCNVLLVISYFDLFDLRNGLVFFFKIFFVCINY